MHLYLHHAVSLALRAPSAFLVEAEVVGAEAVDLGILLLGKEFAYGVVRLKIRYGVGPAAAADRILVHIFDPVDAVEVAREPPEHARKVAGVGQAALQGRIKYVPHEARLAGAAHAGYDGQYAQRDTDVYVFQVVLMGALDGDAVLPWPAGADVSVAPAVEILEGKRFLQLGVAVVARVAFEDNPAAEFSGTRAHIDQPVGGAYDFFVMLDHDDCVTQVSQALEDLDKPLGITGMQSDAGFVQYVH